MNQSRMIYLYVLSFSIIVFINCSLHPQMKSHEAYMRIKPVAPLPEDEDMALPVNLVVTVDNVADMNNSYKNRLDLYINKYLIAPDEVYNYKSTYRYNIRLQPGIYEVKAIYYAHSGWSEKRFPIKTREKVKVFLNKKAVLSTRLEKNHWGAPVDKVTLFNLNYEPLDTK